MQLDRFTTKSRQALEAASSLAAARNHPETTPEHLLAVLLEQEDGIVVPVLSKLGARPEAIRERSIISPPSQTDFPATL